MLGKIVSILFLIPVWKATKSFLEVVLVLMLILLSALFIAKTWKEINGEKKKCTSLTGFEGFSSCSRREGFSSCSRREGFSSCSRRDRMAGQTENFIDGNMDSLIKLGMEKMASSGLDGAAILESMGNGNKEEILKKIMENYGEK
jgi:hypothetical protein